MGLLEVPVPPKKVRLPTMWIKPRQAIYEELTADVSIALGKSLSITDRENKGLHGQAYMYGEIGLSTMATVLAKVRFLYGGRTSGGVFWDLGSGTGKAVFAAALSANFEACCGIELLDSLHAVSTDLLDRWERVAVPRLPEDCAPGPVRFLHGDILALKSEWTRGDVIFANSTCFDERLMVALAEAAEACQVGSFFITTTKRLPSHKWSIVEAELMVMSWGGATVFIHKKVLP